MMPTAWIDRVWVGASFALAALAAGVVLWALLWDAWRTRGARRAGALKRCAGCWYDLSGVSEGAAGARCPECGREAKGERGMLRARRRWRWAAFGVVLLAPAWLAWEMPVVRRDGWARLVPTVVLVCWPGDLPAVWPYQNERTEEGWAARELSRRWGRELLGPVSSRILAVRLRSSAAPGETAEIIPTSDLARDWGEWETKRHWYCCGLAGEPYLSWRFHDETAELRSALVWMLEPWPGGSEREFTGRVFDVENRLVAVGTASEVQRIHALLGLLERAGAQANPLDCGDMTILSPAFIRWIMGDEPRPEARVYRVTALATAVVEPEAWADNGGEVARLRWAAGRLVLQGPERLRRRVVEMLRALARCSAGEPVVNTDDVTICSLEGLPESGDPRDPMARERQFCELRKLLTGAVWSDGWADNSGDAAMLMVDGERLILAGEASMRRRSVELLGSLIRANTDGESTRLGEFVPPRLPGLSADYVAPTDWVLVRPARGVLARWGPEPERAFDRLCRARLAEVDPTAWECGEASAMLLDDVVVLRTDRFGLLERLADALDGAEDGPRGEDEGLTKATNSGE